MFDVVFEKLDSSAIIPTRRPGDVGMDFYAPVGGNNIIIPSGGSTLIWTKLKVKIPEGFCLVGFNKSGMASKEGLIVGSCVIDESYQGEILINLISTRGCSGEAHTIVPGQKLVQFLLLPNYSYSISQGKNIHPVSTERGEGGFGSTGKF